MKDPEIVLEECSPHGNLEAIVEQDDRVAYLYLRAPRHKGFGLKSCWIRNLGSAPLQLDVTEMRMGMPPMLPRDHCAFPAGLPPLEAGKLNLVWFPEGDGVALIDDGEMLAAIPPWGGLNDFPGYARDCIGECTLCWKLSDPAKFHARISAAQQYWAAWEGGTVWPACQDGFFAAYERVLGRHTKYFAIDGNRWPPKALIRVDSGALRYLLSIGISLLPQPQVEMHCDDPASFRRFEFAACFSSEVQDDIIMRFASYLSAQSTLPWEQFTWLGHGHTIGCDAITELSARTHFDSILFVTDPPEAPQFSLPPVFDDKVSLLWAVPITSAERQVAEASGSEEVIRRLPKSWPMHVMGDRPTVF